MMDRIWLIAVFAVVLSAACSAQSVQGVEASCGCTCGHWIPGPCRNGEACREHMCKEDGIQKWCGGGSSSQPVHHGPSAPNPAGKLSSSDAAFIRRGLAPQPESDPQPSSVDHEQFSSDVHQAVGQLKGATSASVSLKDGSTNKLLELQRLKAQDQDLTKRIDTTIKALQRMHFDRRAEDYEEWIKLSQESQREFEDKVKEQITDLIASKVQDQMLESFKHLDGEKADRMIAWLEQDARDRNYPPPAEVIQAIRRLSQVESKGKLAYDAKFVAKAITQTLASMKVKEMQQGLPILLDGVCDLVKTKALQGQCEVFRAISNVTVSALYNNATRRVAIHEVENLNQMTETDLQTLNNYSNTLKDLIGKRNQIRQQIRVLEQS